MFIVCSLQQPAGFFKGQTWQARKKFAAIAIADINQQIALQRAACKKASSTC
ncbi:hypothetical protein ECDEC5B_1395 [Escherichia coli DEC5B]|nr:hypothetical protein ECDEC5B_1395 [Escherichia coli DEC5B]